MTEVRFDKFYRYDELTEILKDWAGRNPELCRLSSIGSSHEGRDIWLMTVTNFETGEDADKPALWLDANIHATEVTGCTAALHLINKLLTDRDGKTTYALDTRTFYIVPRVNPDGPELALAERPRFLRSSTRPYPRADRLDGL
ncbi:MAG: M14 family zinc carboxypeptidase, partial [Actinomycetota bacterium]